MAPPTDYQGIPHGSGAVPQGPAAYGPEAAAAAAAAAATAAATPVDFPPGFGGFTGPGLAQGKGSGCFAQGPMRGGLGNEDPRRKTRSSSSPPGQQAQGNANTAGGAQMPGWGQQAPPDQQAPPSGWSQPQGPQFGFSQPDPNMFQAMFMQMMSWFAGKGIGKGSQFDISGNQASSPMRRRSFSTSGTSANSRPSRGLLRNFGDGCSASKHS